jgi:Phage P22-like portal protein
MPAESSTIKVPNQGPQKSADDLERDRVRKFLDLALERFRMCADAERENRRDSLDDLKFRIGEQWPIDIITQRSAEGTPCLTMNRLPGFLKQITNKQREQRSGPQVNPIGNDSDKDTAKVLQGIIQHIELLSDAEIAYDTAFESMATIGFGYFRIRTDYVEGTFDQEIKIERIKNAFTVYFDPACIQPDYSDARFAFIVEDIPREIYRNDYPRSNAASLSEFTSVGDRYKEWATQDTIRVAEYFFIDHDEKTLVQLQDGRSVYEDELQEGDVPRLGKDNLPITRKEQKASVNWAKINALEILDETVWLGKWIPIVPVLGEDLDVNGRRYLAGAVRVAKDPQRAYNYQISAATEAVGICPKVPYMVAEGQTEGYEEQWKTANIRKQPFLIYKPVASGGQPVAPPQRNAVEPPIESIVLLIRQADNDLKALFGIYDASLGQQGPEQSAKAILARKSQSDIATSDWSDNMARSQRYCGRILIDLIPKIYDAPHVQRIIKPDKSVAQVGVFNSKSTGLTAEDVQTMKELSSVSKIYDIGVGRYDIAISVGSQQTKRQEAADSMMALVQAYPNMVPIIGDLIVQSMDWPLADQVAARLKKGVPPQFLDDDGSDPAITIQKLQGQTQQLQQQNALLLQELQKAAEEIKNETIQAATKMNIEELRQRTNVVVALLNNKIQEGQAQADRELAVTQMHHDAAHEAATQQVDQQHEQTMQQMAGQQAMQQQAAQPTPQGAGQ